jgi:hypothetical protein
MARTPTDEPMTRTMARVVAAAGVLAIAVLAAACSSGSTSATTTTSTRPPSTTTTGGSGTSTSTSGPGTNTTSGGGTAACAATQLTGGLTGGNGAAGTIETTVVLRNTSASTCRTSGYPALQMVDGSGGALPTITVDGGHYSFTSQVPASVTLAAGQAGSFNIGYSDVPVGNETSCPTSAALQVTPPAANGHVTVAATLSPCGGGTLVVSPILAGATGGQ